MTFTRFEELTATYESGELHPGDLKPALAKSLNKILEVMISDYVSVVFLLPGFKSTISIMYTRL